MAYEMDSDYLVALRLQSEFDNELKTTANSSASKKRTRSPLKDNDYNVPVKKLPVHTSLADPEWEMHDPTPDIHSLFMIFNKTFFWEKLNAVEVSWSRRMYSCAGICSYQGRFGLCSIRLSEPLLKLRPRKDLVETLLHEMIHAYLFVTHNNKDRDGHGPEFKKHMYRINQEAGVNITVYHSFHDEVKVYQQHWWRCNGPCAQRPPFYGMVKRSMNRKPGTYDFWWNTHKATCGGSFIKVREPERVNKSKAGTKKENKKKNPDIKSYMDSSNKVMSAGDLKKLDTSGGAIKKVIPSSTSNVITKNVGANRVVGFNDIKNKNSQTKVFSGQASKLGGVSKQNVGSGSSVINKGSGTIVVKPKVFNKTKTNLISEKSPSFTPFSGSGHTLGGSGTKINNSNNNKPISPLVVRVNVPNKNSSKKADTKAIVSTEKIGACPVCNLKIHKDDMGFHIQTCGSLKITTNNAGDPLTCETNNRGVLKKDFDILPKTYYDDFRSINITDDKSDEYKNKNFSPEKYTNDFLNETNSDNELADLDLNDPKIKDDIVPCPVCTMKINRDDMVIHLQTCDILNSTIESMNNSSVLELDDDDDSFNDNSNFDSNNSNRLPNNISMLPCPCCSKLVNEVDINRHLDECLTLSVLNEFS